MTKPHTAPYAIPASTTRVEQVVVNSRFIATAGRADTVEDAKTFIQAVRDEMPGATHHVYAFKVGYGGSVIEGMSDDGEPSGTSGPPVLSVLRGAEIGDIVVVVTRYFGGTKLGTGGLVRAYGGAAKAVLAALPVELKIEKALVGVNIAYSFYERLKLLLVAHQAETLREEFAADVTVFVRLPADQLDSLSDALRNLTSGQSELITLNEADLP